MSDRKLQYYAKKEDEGHLVKEYLKSRFHLSVKEISHAKGFDDGITVNGMHVNVKYKLKENDLLEVVLHENMDSASEIVPIEGNLDIVYEDEDIIVVNKPADLVVHPIHNYFDNSLSNIIAWHFKQNNEEHVLRPVGRLDRETSGLIAFAKNRLAAGQLNLQSENRTKVKEYLAICDGVFKEEESEGTINLPIGKVPEVRMLRRISEDGDYAVTHYKVVTQKQHYALVRLRLETGRTHQIRVHMKAIGHPLLGDGLYADNLSDWYGMKRVALHSSHMEITHPVTGKRLQFDAPIPEDMQKLLNDNLKTITYDFL